MCCRRQSLWFALSLLPASSALAAPGVFSASRHDTSAPLGRLAAAARAPTSRPDTEGIEPRATGPVLGNGRADPVASPLAGPLHGVTQAIMFEGQSAADNRRVLGFAFVPPDTNGAVGATQYVQWVNVNFAIFDADSLFAWTTSFNVPSNA